jgi:hypothetical protein
MRTGRLLAVAAVVLSCACRRSETPLLISDIPGGYACALGNVTHKLILEKNGTFVQEVRKGPLLSGTYSGRWTAGYSEGAVMFVELRPYHFDWPAEVLGAGKTGDWVPPVRHIDNRVAFVISDGAGYYCVQDFSGQVERK